MDKLISHVSVTSRVLAVEVLTTAHSPVLRRRQECKDQSQEAHRGSDYLQLNRNKHKRAD